MWTLYQIAVSFLLVIAAPILLLRRGPHYLPTIPGRLGGHRGKVVRDGLWLHAVSVGEVVVAATVARALVDRRRLLSGGETGPPLLITTVTPTGQERAKAMFRDSGAFGGEVAVAYLPFDLGFALRRFRRRFTPRALVLIEGDYWPLLLRGLRRSGKPIVVVNGRMSDRSFRRLSRLRPFARRVLTAVDRFGVQTRADREKLLRLGVDPDRVTVSGNLKFDSPAPSRSPRLEKKVKEIAAGRPVVVAGSTMAGEEEKVLDAFRRLGGGERAFLVLAPRHPERWGDVHRLIGRADVPMVHRSDFEGDWSNDQSGQRIDLLLLDSLGELAGLYAVADSAFIGGTLVPTGGHNPVEAARFAVPIAIGPSMDNFREMADLFDRAGAWERATDAASLCEIWKGWIEEPASAAEIGQRGARLVEENRGALDATLDLLEIPIQAIDGRGSDDATKTSSATAP